MKKIIVLLALGVIISGCVRISETMDSYLGGLWDFRTPGTVGTPIESEGQVTSAVEPVKEKSAPPKIENKGYIYKK
jgi:hypothetical protein